MFFGVLFVVVLQFRSSSAQVYFTQPIANEVLLAGNPFLVTMYESSSAPFFSQMKSFSLLLLAGTYSTPVTLFAWNLSSTNPASVSNSVTFPSSVGPDLKNGYFLGIQGSLILNDSISVTYFSSRFTLQNMTGASSLLPSSVDPASSTTTNKLSQATIISTETATPGRAITCRGINGQEVQGETGGNGAVVDTVCEANALGVISVLSTQMRTLTAGYAKPPTVTTPPALPFFASATVTSSLSPNGNGGVITTTQTSGNAQPTNTNSTQSSTTTTEEGGIPKTTYMLIIAGITLTTVILLFWLWLRYRRRNACPAPPCSHQGPCTCHSPPSLLSLLPFFRPRSNPQDAEKNVPSRPATAHPSTPDESQRMRFEEAYRKRRTIVAELEGDLGDEGIGLPRLVPLSPFILPSRAGSVMGERRMADKRRTEVFLGQEGRLVRGREAVDIVAVGKRALASSSSSGSGGISGTIGSVERELGRMPAVFSTEDEVEERRKREARFSQPFRTSPPQTERRIEGLGRSKSMSIPRRPVPIHTRHIRNPSFDIPRRPVGLQSPPTPNFSTPFRRNASVSQSPPAVPPFQFFPPPTNTGLAPAPPPKPRSRVPSILLISPPANSSAYSSTTASTHARNVSLTEIRRERRRRKREELGRGGVSVDGDLEGNRERGVDGEEGRRIGEENWRGHGDRYRGGERERLGNFVSISSI